MKLDIGPGDVARLKHLPLLRPDDHRSVRPQKLRAVYFDTDDRLLHRSGVELRVRHVRRRCIQTIKAQSGATAGLFDRLEWEQPLKGERPDLTGLKGTQLRSLLGHAPEELVLKPVFETNIQRTPRRIIHQDSEIELVIDEGEIRNGASSVPVHELELELKSGERTGLFQLATELAGAIDLRLSIDSKASRGYALLAQRAPHAEKAAHLALKPGDETGAAFQEIARSCLAHLLANERVLRETATDPNAIHQMRVAVRRLRAAISCFRTILADEQTAALKTELKWLAGELAVARHLDVFLAAVLEPVRRQRGADPEIQSLVAAFEKRRDEAYPKALEATQSLRCRQLTLGTLSWIETGAWAQPADAAAKARLNEPVKTLAARELKRCRRKLERSPPIADLTPGQRHEFRIQAKKLRYAVEFFGELYGGKKARKRRKAFSAALARLQDELGALNDIAEAEATLATVANEMPHLAFSAGLVTGHALASVDGTAAKAAETYDELMDIKPFWR